MRRISRSCSDMPGWRRPRKEEEEEEEEKEEGVLPRRRMRRRRRRGRCMEEEVVEGRVGRVEGGIEGVGEWAAMI